MLLKKNQNYFLVAFYLLACGLSTVASANQTAIEAMLQNPNRELTDRLRDPIRKPAQVLEFLGIETGMKVFEVYAAGGYYTVILSAAVGDEGIVFAQNSPRVLLMEEDRSDVTATEALDAKLKALNLSNVRRVDQSLTNIELMPNSLDAAVIFLIFHDYYNSNPNRAAALLERFKAAVKPGGVIGIIDHVGLPDTNNRRFHRMEKSEAIEAIHAAGLEVEAESDLLANSRDDRRRGIFDPRYNRDTDRFLLRIRVPSE